MPRYQNLKGSMNPFSNNKPVLSASERLKNKRDKTIYQSQKMNYQSSKTCGNKNVKYYDNGTIRSTNSFKMNMKLSRGAALCDDCDNNGTFCKPLIHQKKNTKIDMGNNRLSVLSMDAGIIPSGGDTATNVQNTNVIISDVDGVWGGSPTDISKSLIGPGWASFPYGYITNLIKIPRNLDGSGVIIDPSNLLFEQDNNCNTKNLGKPNFLKLASINTTIVYTGIIGKSTGSFTSAADLYDRSNIDQILNNFCVFSFTGQLGSLDNGAATAVVLKICFAGTQIINNNTGGFLGGTKFSVDIFKIFLTINSRKNEPLWQGTIFPPVDGSIQNPSFKPNTISEFSVKGFSPILSGPASVSFLIDSFWCQNYAITAPFVSNFGAGARMNIELQQNNIKCSNSQIRGNETKQNYLSCVEDGTKNIKFTKNSV
jgi:hypothetical protein